MPIYKECAHRKVHQGECFYVSVLYCFDLLKSERIVFSVGRSLWSEGLDKTGVLYNFLIPQGGIGKNTDFWQIGEVGQNAPIIKLTSISR